MQERDRFFMAMLKPLGIEKGKPFAPTARQKKILTDAAEMGQLMAKANTYTKRFEDPYWPGARWKDVLAVNTTQREGNIEQLDERASYFYEAVAISEAMRSTTPGFGRLSGQGWRLAHGRKQLPPARGRQPAGQAILVGDRL